MSENDRAHVRKYQDENNPDTDNPEVVVKEDDAEVVGEIPAGPDQSQRVEDAKTYELRENGVKYQIQPRVLSSGETRWTIVAFLPSVQGPVFQGQRISDDAADDLGLSRSTQNRLNTLVERANERLGLPSSLRGEERERAPLGDLADALNDDEAEGDAEEAEAD